VVAIDSLLRSAGEPQESERVPLAYERLNLSYYEPAPRPEAPVLPVSERSAYEEIEGALTRRQVLGEGQRCFSCGSCLACDNCWTLCPDVAVLKTHETASDGSHYVFDYSYCKGCGLCAHECPSGYIVMRDEI
jgi:Pyruvate/2-oxoacid:ferredoxin oxidoreductase delta subunit